MLGCDCCCLTSFVYLVGLLAIASKVIPFLMKTLKGKKPVELQEKNFKKDVVYLYQFPGSPTASSMSPYCVKVEAFCRLHEIKFERRDTFSDRGQNSMLPFIELNGEQHSDSQIILRRVAQIFNLKVYPDAYTAALGHAIDRLIDNHTFNLLYMAKASVASKFVEAMAISRGLPAFLVPLASRIGGYLVGKKMISRGAGSIGKFTETEYKELLRNDLTQLQTILGGKLFLLGGNPTVVDCTAFGQFGSLYAVPAARFYVHDLLDSAEYAPLREYLERVKECIFGDEFCDNE